MTSGSDPVETSEWRESFDSVLEFDGVDRASFLLEELINEARRNWGTGAVLGEHTACEHDPAGQAAATPVLPLGLAHPAQDAHQHLV